jgi:hypothetical protein
MVMQRNNSVSGHVEAMLASHRARLFALQFERVIATQPSTLTDRIECEIERLAASIDRLRRVSQCACQDAPRSRQVAAGDPWRASVTRACICRSSRGGVRDDMGESLASHDLRLMIRELCVIAMEAKTETEQTERAWACLRRYGRLPPQLEPEVLAMISRRGS